MMTTLEELESFLKNIKDEKSFNAHKIRAIASIMTLDKCLNRIHKRECADIIKKLSTTLDSLVDKIDSYNFDK